MEKIYLGRKNYYNNILIDTTNKSNKYWIIIKQYLNTLLRWCVYIISIHLVTFVSNQRSSKRFCKEVIKLILRINKGGSDSPDGNILSKKVTTDFYMLCPFMKNWIRGEVQSWMVVTYKFHRTDIIKMKFL